MVNYELLFSILVVGLFMYLFLRSTGLCNDLGMRNAWYIWFGLAIFSGIFYSRFEKIVVKNRSFLLRFFILIVLLVGLLATVYEFTDSVSPRYVPIDDYNAFLWLDKNTPPDSTVQRGILYVDDMVGYQTRKAIISDIVHGKSFYVNNTRFEELEDKINTAFNTTDPNLSRNIFYNLGVDYVYLSDYERKNYVNLDKFENTEYFDGVYREGGVTIYKIK